MSRLFTKEGSPESLLREGPGGLPPGADGRALSGVPAVLRKQLQGAAGMRASVRPGNMGRMGSRASVRGSIRPAGGASSGMSGLSPVTERAQVVDEQGRDRTPKPLLAIRGPPGGVGEEAERGGEGPDGGPSSVEVPALHVQQFGALASLAVFNINDVGSDAPESARGSARGPQADASAPAAEQGVKSRRGSVVVPAGRRNKAAQCERPGIVGRGCQVLPWELAAGEGQQPGLEPDPSSEVRPGRRGQREASADGEGQEDSAEQEAMLAMAEATIIMQDSQQLQGSGRESHLRLESSMTARMSMAGSRASGNVFDTSRLDSSRRTSRASALNGDMTERGSLAASRSAFMDGPAASFMLSSRTNTARPSSNMALAGYTSRQQAGSVMSASEAAAEAAKRQKAEAQRALARLPGIEPTLRSLERLLAQNAYQGEVAKCKHVQLCSGTEAGDAAVVKAAQEKGRGAPSPLDRATSSTPGAGLEGPAAAAVGIGRSRSSLDPKELWQWKSDVTEDLPVSCIAWNKVSPDLLAVGYGQLEYSVAAKGMVAFFSLRNPRHPIWHFSTPCGVSALDFSRRAGGLLAVGCFDGSVAVYDVRSKAGTPIARALPAGPDGSGGHAEPVWTLRYVGVGSSEGEAGEGEMLVSVSTDGRVLSWKHTQSLDPVELMVLKRSAQAQRRAAAGGKEQQGAHTEDLLGRQAGGTCFDFSPVDPRVYIVGTEEGLVRKCSTAFTEQYSQTYSGHAAPVYQVRWCPFRPSCFLTCSADWTLRLWSEAQSASLWTFQLANANREINDAQWCPANATVFAAAAGNTLQLWDLEYSVLKPRSTVTRYGMRLTALSFCAGAPVLVCGADDGSVTVYSMAGLYREQSTPEEEAARLAAALQASVLQQLPS